MSDDFKLLKDLGKQMSKKPSQLLFRQWVSVPEHLKPIPIKRSNNWWQLVAALFIGILIGKFLLYTEPDFLSTMANNSVEDETFEYIYTNN